MRSAPAAMTLATSSPSRAKSAERMLGAMRKSFPAMGVEWSSTRRAILRGIARARPRRPGFLCYHLPMPAVKKYSVAVTAHSTYLPDQSDEEEDRYVFAYTIRITDADNQVQEVRGMGVVGEQPVLKPGDTFEYSSGSSIPTAVGTMR